MEETKKKVLIIEDDSFLLQMYATKLEMEGFEVQSALEGARGLTLAQKIKPDVILLDLLMPKVDGFEVLEKLKSGVATKDIPVIVLSNLSQREDVQRCFNLGADDYLIKAHFIPSEVIDKIKRVIQETQ